MIPPARRARISERARLILSSCTFTNVASAASIESVKWKQAAIEMNALALIPPNDYFVFHKDLIVASVTGSASAG